MKKDIKKKLKRKEGKIEQGGQLQKHIVILYQMKQIEKIQLINFLKMKKKKLIMIQIINFFYLMKQRKMKMMNLIKITKKIIQTEKIIMLI